MKGKKITKAEYKAVKRTLRFHSDNYARHEYKLSLASVMRIRGSNNYEQFEELSRAEHRLTGARTLGQRVKDLEAKVEEMEQYWSGIIKPSEETADTQ